MRIINQATILLCLFALTGMDTSAIQSKADKKLAPAELVAKHLEAIAPMEVRARVPYV